MTTPGQELEVIELTGGEVRTSPVARLAVAPEIEAAELVKRLDVIEAAMRTAMKEGVDYGQVPGTSGKPSLLKPGAEKLGALFQLDVQLDNEKIWHEDGHLTVICRATVFHQPTSIRLGSGEGICTTREAKYAFRQGVRVCPACGQGTVFKSKQGRDEFFCWQKKGGCGEAFPAGTSEYETLATADVGQSPNPNIADTYNTVDKMASKRARIDAVLAVTGASALFTQDVEDSESSNIADEHGAASTSTAKPKTPDGLASDSQRNYISRLIQKLQVAYDIPADLTKGAATELIEQLKAGDLSGIVTATCGECGGINGEHADDCSEKVPF